MIVPSTAFRPNPNRAVYLDGSIDEAQLSRITPVILRLLSEGREPITIYILNSPGGSVSIMEAILQLLNSVGQDFEPSCSLITAVTSRAASAAADLLASGDYAIAYPGCTILYHGVRTPLRDATAELTSMMAHYLRLSNDRYAMRLSRKIEFRFMWRFAILKGQFPGIRDEKANSSMSDAECFLEAIAAKLSEPAQKIFARARGRYQRYEKLLAYVTKSSATTLGQDNALVEGGLLKAIIDFETAEKNGDPDWSFKGGGIAQVADDFFILNEYLDIQQSDRLTNWCNQYGSFALSREGYEETKEIEDEDVKRQRTTELVRPALEPVLSFFVAFCHVLQEGENELTAQDAYWLGLVDEVYGNKELSALRMVGEYQDDPVPESTPTQE